MASKKTRKNAPMANGDFAAFMASVKKDDSIINLNDRIETFYKTGDRNLDKALGGGFPSGQIYALQGAPSSGKSLMSLGICKSVLETTPESRVVYFDTENKISKKAVTRMGLQPYADEDRFIMLTVSNLEDMIDTAVNFADTGYFKMIVIDSIDSLTTDEQEERDIHDGSKVGGYKAKVLSEHLPRVVRAAATNDCSIMFVQQIRKNPGVMYGSPDTTSGGEAIKFYVTTRLGLRPCREYDQEQDGILTYQGAAVRVLKTNQGSIPNDAINIRYYIGDDPSIPWGIDPLLSISDAALSYRIFMPTTAGGHNYVACNELSDMLGIEHGTLKFNGKKNLNAAIQADEELRDYINQIIDKRCTMSDEDIDVANGVETEHEVDDDDFEDIE